MMFETDLFRLAELKTRMAEDQAEYDKLTKALCTRLKNCADSRVVVDGRMFECVPKEGSYEDFVPEHVRITSVAVLPTPSIEDRRTP